MSDKVIAAEIIRQVIARGSRKTICPSEVARTIAEDQNNWRELMPEVRRVAIQLADAGEIVITQKGQQVADLTAIRGPIRLGKAAP